MQKTFTLILVSLLTISAFAQSSNRTAAAFTTGNIVVYRVGDGSAALTSAATAIFIDEYTPSGALVQSIPLPTTISGANKRIMASGSASSEGLMTRSADGKFLLVTGYDAPVGTASVVSTASTDNNRVVGVIDAAGNIDATTALTDAYSGNNMRGATSTNGTDIWVSGTATTGGSVRYTTKGSTTTTQLSTTITNIRGVAVYNGQLYCSSASGTFQGVSSVGTGTPNTSGQTITLLNGFPTTSGPSTYAFAIKPTAGDIAYVADDRATPSGGIQKWTLSAGTWTLAYTLNTGITVGARSVTVNWSGANPVVYAVTTDGKIVSTTDAGASSSFATLVTAATNTAIRGIALAPTNAVAPLNLLSFNAALKNGLATASWKTLNEINVSHFEVERSNDAIGFNKIGTVNANNQISNSYLFTDATAITHNTYFRLKMVDKDGSFRYSSIVLVSSKATNAISVFPNPAKNNIVVNYSEAKPNTVAKIVSAEGKQLASYNLPIGSVTNSIDISNLPKGNYLLALESGNGKQTASFLKL